jgi:hypothetical protein
VIEHARRSSHYSAGEVAALAFEGAAPDAADLSRRWSRALTTARTLIETLPANHVGEAVLTVDGQLFRGHAADLEPGLSRGEVVFHPGRVGGALPRIAS